MGLFLYSSSGVGLFCSTRSGGGAVLQWFQRWNSNNFVSSHSSVMPILYAAYRLYWRLGEKGCGLEFFVIFLCSLYCVRLLRQCYVAICPRDILVITRALGMHGIYIALSPRGLRPRASNSVQYIPYIP